MYVYSDMHPKIVEKTPICCTNGFSVRGGGGGSNFADMSATNRCLFMDVFPNSGLATKGTSKKKCILSGR